MDISKFFDTIDHGLLMRAVEKHINIKWILLYIKRWLTVSYQRSDGQIVKRHMGVPQGSVICPILANLFLHYTFDKWMSYKNILTYLLRDMLMIVFVIVVHWLKPNT